MTGYIPPGGRRWVLGFAGLLLIGAVAAPVWARRIGSYEGDLPQALLYGCVGCISVAILLVSMAYASYRDDEDPDDNGGDGGSW